NDLPGWRTLVVRRRAVRFHVSGQSKIERPNSKIDMVTAEILQRASAKMPPSPPVERHVLVAVVAVLNRTEPELPVKVRRSWLRLGPSSDIPGSVDPVVNFADLADGPALDQFNHPSIVRARVYLVAHLGHLAAAAC